MNGVSSLGQTLSRKGKNEKQTVEKDEGPGIDPAVFSLGKSELEYLLSRIKDMTFKGEELNLVVSIVYKLQNQHRVAKEEEQNTKQLLKG